MAFAPDGHDAVVSPGDGAFVLDVATGAVRAVSDARAAVLDVAYGLERPAASSVAQTSLAAHCNHIPERRHRALLDVATWPRLAPGRRPGAYATRPGPRHPGVPRVTDRRSRAGRSAVGQHPACARSGSATAPPLPAPGLRHAAARRSPPDGASVLVNDGETSCHAFASTDVTHESFVTNVGSASGPSPSPADGSVVAIGGTWRGAPARVEHERRRRQRRCAPPRRLRPGHPQRPVGAVGRTASCIASRWHRHPGAARERRRAARGSAERPQLTRRQSVTSAGDYMAIGAELERDRSPAIVVARRRCGATARRAPSPDTLGLGWTSSVHAR